MTSIDIANLKTIPLIENIHTYPLLHLITLDTALVGLIVWCVSKYFKLSVMSTVSLLIVSLVINAYIHKFFGITTNIATYIGI
jgi:hypothetical protein